MRSMSLVLKSTAKTYPALHSEYLLLDCLVLTRSSSSPLYVTTLLACDTPYVPGVRALFYHYYSSLLTRSVIDAVLSRF